MPARNTLSRNNSGSICSMNSIKTKRRTRTDGFALLMAIMLVLTVSVVVGFFLYAASNHSRAVRRWHDSDQCLLDAQSALEQVKYGLAQAYRSNQVSAAGSLEWFKNWNIRAIGSNPVYTIPALGPINGSVVAVTIANVNIETNSGYAEITLIGAAGRSNPYAANRMINETLLVNAVASDDEGLAQPFDYAYLLNKAGTLRANMVINGDIRINGNYKLNNKSYVNGKRNASGKITANSPLWSVSDYWKSANTTPSARPTDPTATKNISWPMGYVPDKSKNKNLPVYTMPAIGDIATMSPVVGGRIIQGTNTIVNTYAGAGPDGIAGTADDNTLVLDGLKSTITIQGSVFIKGDVIIRGKVAGQGTIYAGRNVHVVGDLSYVNPPSWPKPDSAPVKTMANNEVKDLLVLAAKGNVVVGNYTSSTWSNRVWSIMTASANVKSYGVSASDAAIGYDSDNNPANGYLFDGRYYVNEVNNGRRLSGIGTNTVARKYYESSLANSTFNALCDANNVPNINAALFSNHGIIGNLGSSAAGGNTVLNGAMACHDEMNDFYGKFTINWDIRLGSQSKERLNTYFMSASSGTGGVESISTTIGWKEIH